MDYLSHSHRQRVKAKRKIRGKLFRIFLLKVLFVLFFSYDKASSEDIEFFHDNRRLRDKDSKGKYVRAVANGRDRNRAREAACP